MSILLTTVTSGLPFFAAVMFSALHGWAGLNYFFDLALKWASMRLLIWHYVKFQEKLIIYSPSTNLEFIRTVFSYIPLKWEISKWITPSNFCTFLLFFYCYSHQSRFQVIVLFDFPPPGLLLWFISSPGLLLWFISPRPSALVHLTPRPSALVHLSQPGSQWPWLLLAGPGSFYCSSFGVWGVIFWMALYHWIFLLIHLVIYIDETSSFTIHPLNFPCYPGILMSQCAS